MIHCHSMSIMTRRTLNLNESIHCPPPTMSLRVSAQQKTRPFNYSPVLLKQRACRCAPHALPPALCPFPCTWFAFARACRSCPKRAVSQKEMYRDTRGAVQGYGMRHYSQSRSKDVGL